MKDLYRVIQDKLRGESPYQGHYPHTSSEQESESSMSSSMSSGYERYIQKEKEPIVYYITDEYVTVSDPTDHLGLKNVTKRRKVIRDLAPRKRRRLHGVKREKTHKDSNVRREPTKLVYLSPLRQRMRREVEARRDEMCPPSSTWSSSNSLNNYDPDPYNYVPQARDLSNCTDNGAGNPIETRTTENLALDIEQGDQIVGNLNLNTDQTDLLLPEKEQSVKNESNENKGPFANFAAKSQFHRKRYESEKKGLYWRNLSNYNSNISEFSFDSDSFSIDSDSLVLAATD